MPWSCSFSIDSFKNNSLHSGDCNHAPKKCFSKLQVTRTMTMKTKYSSKAYAEVVEKFNLVLDLEPEQSAAFDEGKGIILSENQIDIMINQLSTQDGIDSFVRTTCTALQPLSFSLFVINDRLWNMMKRKTWDQEKMLAMATIPLCTWDQKHETMHNPKGIKRWPIKPNSLEISFEPKAVMRIQGEGGDFSGFIEQSHLTMKKWGIPDTRKLLPNYVFESLRIETKLDHAVLEIHPAPRDELDYDFSDHARVFFEHGFLIHAPGKDVTLQVGKRKPTQMAGDVLLLAGKRFGKGDDSNQELLVDIWLKTFEKRMLSVK